jgi:dimeric dUTPase (all-alpha-NTP-PPase superfamily)
VPEINPTNVCSGLEVEDMDMTDPFAEMFMMQYRLQHRLGKIPEMRTLELAVQQVMYWQFCVADEVKELLDWFDPVNSMLAPNRELLMKEVQMEAIDALHFVFNIGLELGYAKETISSMEAAVEYRAKNFDVAEMARIGTWLNNAVINLIRKLPWKSWKTYPEIDLPTLAAAVEPEYAKVIGAILALCMTCMMRRQDIINVYCAKNKENHNRQNNGY